MESDPSLPYLPLDDICHLWELSKVEQFLDKFERLAVYRDLFDHSHPWNHRLPLHILSFTEREQMEELLEHLPDDISTLRKLYAELDRSFPQPDLIPEKNAALVQLYIDINTAISQPATLADIEALRFSRASTERLWETLEKMRENASGIRSMHLARGWSIGTNSNKLIKHQAAYQSLSDSPIRYFSYSYQSARWYLNKLLAPKHQKINADINRVIGKELKHFKRIRKLYSVYYANPFMEDFPLLDSQKEKWDWIKRKEYHFKAFRRITSKALPSALQPSFLHKKLDMAHWYSVMKTISQLSTFTQLLAHILTRMAGVFPSSPNRTIAPPRKGV